jgi:hypothetical protein
MKREIISLLITSLLITSLLTNGYAWASYLPFTSLYKEGNSQRFLYRMKYYSYFYTILLFQLYRDSVLLVEETEVPGKTYEWFSTMTWNRSVVFNWETAKMTHTPLQ